MNTHVEGSTPYPWPYDGTLAGPQTALVVLDAMETGGSSAAPRHAATASAIGALAEAVRICRGVVILAKTTRPARLGSALPPRYDLVGSGLLDGEKPSMTIRAQGIDAFFGSDLDLLLRSRGVRRILLAGSGLETSVHSTMRSANDRGYECLLVADACIPHDPDLVPFALSMIEMSGGIFGAVGTSAPLISALFAANRPASENPISHTQGALA